MGRRCMDCEPRGLSLSLSRVSAVSRWAAAGASSDGPSTVERGARVRLRVRLRVCGACVGAKTEKIRKSNSKSIGR